MSAERVYDAGEFLETHYDAPETLEQARARIEAERRRRTPPDVPMPRALAAILQPQPQPQSAPQRQEVPTVGRGLNWTTKEDEVIRANAHLGAEGVARMLEERSAKSVALRASRLGVHLGRMSERKTADAAQERESESPAPAPASEPDDRVDDEISDAPCQLVTRGGHPGSWCGECPPALSAVCTEHHQPAAGDDAAAGEHQPAEMHGRVLGATEDAPEQGGGVITDESGDSAGGCVCGTAAQGWHGPVYGADGRGSIRAAAVPDPATSTEADRLRGELVQTHIKLIDTFLEEDVHDLRERVLAEVREIVAVMGGGAR
jgi:hypothetical protein